MILLRKQDLEKDAYILGSETDTCDWSSYSVREGNATIRKGHTVVPNIAIRPQE